MKTIWPGPHPVELGLERLLDLEHELGALPHLGRPAGYAGAGRPVGVVRNRAADPGAGLDDHLVPARRERRHAGRRDGHAVLVRLDLRRDADAHDTTVP